MINLLLLALKKTTGIADLYEVTKLKVYNKISRIIIFSKR
jgi:hypothetical protein